MRFIYRLVSTNDGFRIRGLKVSRSPLTGGVGAERGRDRERKKGKGKGEVPCISHFLGPGAKKARRESKGQIISKSPEAPGDLDERKGRSRARVRGGGAKGSGLDRGG